MSLFCVGFAACYPVIFSDSLSVFSELRGTASSALADALAQYPRTILFVSHDRYFVSRIASRVLSLCPRNGLQESAVESVLHG